MRRTRLRIIHSIDGAYHVLNDVGTWSFECFVVIFMTIVLFDFCEYFLIKNNSLKDKKNITRERILLKEHAIAS